MEAGRAAEDVNIDIDMEKHWCHWVWVRCYVRMEDDGCDDRL
jgi:hypothetical protein